MCRSSVPTPPTVRLLSVEHAMGVRNRAVSDDDRMLGADTHPCISTTHPATARPPR